MLTDLAVGAVSLVVITFFLEPLFRDISDGRPKRSVQALRYGRERLYSGAYFILVSALFFVMWILKSRGSSAVLSVIFLTYGAWLVMTGLNVRLEYDRKGIRLRNCFGFVKKCDYNMIIKAFRTSSGLVFHVCDGRKLRVPSQLEGIGEFYEMAERVLQIENKK